MTFFIIGAVLGLIWFITFMITQQHPWGNWETPLGLLIFPLIFGWALSFAAKLIQWPFN